MPIFPKELIEPPIFSEELIKTNQKNVVLFGPHDRYNFGDLLFTKVLLRLLQTRAGYKEDEILLGGMISVNMTRYGGEDKILSMRTIQGLSWEDKSKGPYDIVFTGGESTGCTHDCAVGMFTGNEAKRLARSEKIYDCAYLIPKDFLVPKSKDAQKLTNNAIVNSVGGIPRNPACKRAVDSADFVAFRDHEPLYPDSAVMTRELYGEKINSLAKEVMQELFHNDTAGQKKYIVVQHKACSSDSAKNLASALDIVSKESETTIVFLAAGTAPGHDSFASYKKVASFMKEPSVVYEAEHVWKVVAVISGAEAVLGTSLHIRIMAFIYWKPRITWCTPRNDGDGKHDKFISLWDIGSAECLQNSSQTWSVLSGYFGSNANSTQLETTKISYYKAVKKYLEGFDKWSCLLRNRSDCNGGEN